MKKIFQMDSSDDESVNGEFYDALKEEQEALPRAINFDARVSKCKINLLQVTLIAS